MDQHFGIQNMKAIQIDKTYSSFPTYQSAPSVSQGPSLKSPPLSPSSFLSCSVKEIQYNVKSVWIQIQTMHTWPSSTETRSYKSTEYKIDDSWKSIKKKGEKNQ